MRSERENYEGLIVTLPLTHPTNYWHFVDVVWIVLFSLLYLLTLL